MRIPAVKKLLALLLVLLALTACGRVVTDKTFHVREAVFTFNFRGDTANPNYKYYFVVATQNIFDNLINGELKNFYPPEFAVTANWEIPAEYNPVNSVEGIFETFYAKWAAYYKYDRSDVQWKQYNGPFVYGQTIVEIPTEIRVPPGSSNQLNLKLVLEPQAEFYFTLLTVYETNTSAKRLVSALDWMGRIESNTTRIPTQNQNKLTGSSYPGLDIQSYSVIVTEY